MIEWIGRIAPRNGEQGPPVLASADRARRCLPGRRRRIAERQGAVGARIFRPAGIANMLVFSIRLHSKFLDGQPSLTYSVGVWTKPITVVELPTFLRSAAKVWADDEREAFIDYIAQSPEAGAIIPGTGGIRKVRWSRQGSGKRGGVRVIYFYHDMNNPLFLITLYAKANRGDISSAEKQLFASYVAELKRGLRG